MKIIKDLKQGSDEWLKLRLGRFGSTDAQAVGSNGRGLDTLCYQKAAEIITGKAKETYRNADMERGNELEGMARMAYELETGNLVEEVAYFDFDEFTGGSPDGLVGDEGLVEIKCPSDANFVKEVFTKKIKSKYIWQMQHLMFVSDRKWCDYIIFNENLDRIEITRVERDEEAIEKIKEGLEAGKEKIKNILEKIK
jgi:putative phage-type endonuclease